MNKIGAIGQGPGEYSRFYQMAINETERIIYVYRMDISALLSFSYEGTFLNKHSLQLPKEWAWKFYYLEDKFYFYYLVNADSESAPYMYAITDTIGNLLYSKLDESLHFSPGNYPSFPSHISISRFPALFQKFPTPLLDFSGFCHSQVTVISGNLIFQKVGVCTQQSVP